METDNFDIRQSGLLVHGIRISGLPEDRREDSIKWGSARLRNILEGNWPRGGAMGGGVCFNLTGVRLKDGGKIGFEGGMNYSLYSRDTGDWYTCPYIILNDILQKISPNFVKQAVENGIANDASWEQIILDRQGFHIGNIKWAPEEDWRTFPEMPYMENPQPEFYSEEKNERKYYPPKRDFVPEEQMFSRVLSPERITAIIVPRKIGYNPEDFRGRKDLESRPQRYFLEELCKIRNDIGEVARNIPIYDDLGKRLI